MDVEEIIGKRVDAIEDAISDFIDENPHLPEDIKDELDEALDLAIEAIEDLMDIAEDAEGALSPHSEHQTA